MKFLKPKFWNEQKNIFSTILLPVSLLYKIIFFFKKKISVPKKFNIPVICIGNIYLGGTGKTPLSLLLFEKLKKIRKPVIIKKYYKKHKDEHDLIIAKESSLIVHNTRGDAIRIAENKDFDVALLDDGFQDYTIKKDLNIICFNSRQLIGNGLVLPAGPLREDIKSIQRAQIIVINGRRNKEFEEKIFNISKNIKIFYSKYSGVNLEKFKSKKFLAFAGIGNPNNFFELLLENKLEIKKTFSFPDHYNYKKKDLEKIIHEAKKNNLEIITTEKDYERIKIYGFKEIKFLRINLILEDIDKFTKQILDYLK